MCIISIYGSQGLGPILEPQIFNLSMHAAQKELCLHACLSANLAHRRREDLKHRAQLFHKPRSRTKAGKKLENDTKVAETAVMLPL